MVGYPVFGLALLTLWAPKLETSCIRRSAKDGFVQLIKRFRTSACGMAK